MPWHNVCLFFSQKYYTIERTIRHRRLIHDFIMPVVNYSKLKDLIESFHFFYEGNRLELRLELGDGVTRDEVRDITRKHLSGVSDLIEKHDVVDYHPEFGEGAYGIDGWEIAKKIFEYGSRLAIALLDPEFRRGKLLHQGKLIHCMLNSLNYSWDKERNFYIHQAVGREVIIISKERHLKPENVNIKEAKQRVKDYIDKVKIGIKK